MLVLIEEMVDQPPIAPFVVRELCGGPAAATTHRRRAPSAVIRGERTGGPLEWCLDSTGRDPNRDPAGRRAAAVLRLEEGRVYRRDGDGWFGHLRPSSRQWVLAAAANGALPARRLRLCL
jgi:hypothetical protein